MLEVADQDYKELDLASTGGIDNIRDLREKCKYKPLRSKYRMYLLDECFAEGTQIETPNGVKTIESFIVGDSVYSSNGADVVTNTFVKEIPLDRLIRVEMENGKTLFCSDKHEVFTEKGWKNSEDLANGDLLLPFCCDLVASTNGETRGQRTINNTTKTASSNSGKFVGNGIQHIIGSSKRWIPNKLQGGYSSPKVKNSCGSRRKQPQTPEQYSKRFEENKETSRIRVASVARYERGNNDQLFSSVVKGKEVRQGFINLYDLEVESIPNYFANGVLVHNCHQVTSQAQEAMLKWLEDCPKHVIIVLATTDPQKLIKTILTRCNKFQMNLLSREEMRVLVEWVLDNEEITLPKKVVSEIIKKSEGSPRNALTLLDNVIEMEDEDAAMEILEGGTGEGSKETIDLCRLLMDGRATWKQYQSLLGAIKDEPESVRYSVLGFFNSVILREKDEKKIKRAVAVLECFSDNYYDTKKSGLIYSCFSAYHGIDA